MPLCGWGCFSELDCEEGVDFFLGHSPSEEEAGILEEGPGAVDLEPDRN